jgi:ADP-L-glycero-D-manno-heptose 6-epimerase
VKCLVTGGAGFIGSNLALELEKQGHNVVIVDNLSSGHKDNLKGIKGKFILSDISKTGLFKEKFDVIFHQAAITDPRHGNDEDTLSQNINGFKNVLNLAKQSKAKLIYASSASLYGNTSSPQREDQEKELQSAYAESKLIMDEMASYHCDEMHIVGLRYFNVFGPNEKYKGRPASMIYHLITQIREGKTPKLFKWGEQKRDHIYVKDVVRANLLALDAKPGIYNVGTGKATTFKELFTMINSVLGTKIEPEYIDMPYDKNKYQVDTQADTTRAQKYLGFKAEYNLKDAIKEYSRMI